MSSTALLHLSDTKEVAKLLAKHAMRAQGLRRVKEAAGVGKSIADMGSKALNWVTDPAHLATRLPMVGAGVGGLTGLLSSYNRPEEDRQPFRSVLTGALAGGAVGLGGAAAKGLYDRYTGDPSAAADSSELSKSQQDVGDIEAIPEQVEAEQGAFYRPAEAGAVAGAVAVGSTPAQIWLNKSKAVEQMLADYKSGIRAAEPSAQAAMAQMQQEGVTVGGRKLRSPFYRRQSPPTLSGGIPPAGGGLVAGGKKWLPGIQRPWNPAHQLPMSAGASNALLRKKLPGKLGLLLGSLGTPAAIMLASYLAGQARNRDLAGEKATALLGGQ